MSDEDLSGLERQVERGNLFTHTALSRGFLRFHELESFVYGLIDALVARGAVTTEEVAGAVEAVRGQLETDGEIPEPGLALRADSPEQAGSPPVHVDCAARMHICHAVCCKLDFALSAGEVEAGKVKWDLGRPYLIRHDSHNLCVHNDRSTGGCRVYADRPLPCRRYSCAKDERIWKSFERMELNQGWLDEHLAPSEPRLRHAMLAGRGDPELPAD